jgi:VWFA-related protein
MKTTLEFRFSTALLIVALVYAMSAVPISAQTTEQPPPFGSSLKRSKVEVGRQAKEQANPKPVEDNLPQPEEIIRVNTSLVNLDVLVTDAKDSRYISGLTKDDFVLSEDNQPQLVATVAVGDDTVLLPRSIVLIFDRSESQFPYLESSIEAAKELVNQLAPSDEMAIVTDDVELAIGFTKEKKKLRKTLDSLKKLTLNGYRTRSMQFSALLATLRELIDRSKKRPIIIFQTDGDEAAQWDQQRPSDYDMNTVYSEVEKSRTKIYTVIPNTRLIGIPKEEITGRLSLMMENAGLARSKYKDMWYGAERVHPKMENNPNRTKPLPENLRVKLFEMMTDKLIKGQTAAARVADLTGGWTSFLEKPEQANEIYGRILSDINHRYIISYYPTNKELDGKLRKVRIEVLGHPDYVVQGRTSYYAIPR